MPTNKVAPIHTAPISTDTSDGIPAGGAHRRLASHGASNASPVEEDAGQGEGGGFSSNKNAFADCTVPDLSNADATAAHSRGAGARYVSPANRALLPECCMTYSHAASPTHPSSSHSPPMISLKYAHTQTWQL